MRELIFATQNKHKLLEVSSLLGNQIKLVALADLRFKEELPETHETLSENALEKATFIFNLFNKNCIAEDTGLEIDALYGEPGVYSARYAGEGKNADDNIDLVLKKMNGIENRRARFRTVIALFGKNKRELFEGITEGDILIDRNGSKGFGYDPIFKPDGSDKSYDEMDLEEKNTISHRAKAFHKLAEYLKNSD